MAECFPGAQVTSAEGDTFAGSVKVKLGPIALVYNGTGTFVEKDEAAKRFVVDAKGKDKRGNGTAGAHVTVTMTDADGSTDVSVQTDLAITGKPAQFGRGVMQDVSDKLLGQFVDCLEARLTARRAGSRVPKPRRRQRSAAGTVARRIRRTAPPRHAARPHPRRSTWAARCCRSWRGPTGNRPSAASRCSPSCGGCCGADAAPWARVATLVDVLLVRARGNACASGGV